MVTTKHIFTCISSTIQLTPFHALATEYFGTCQNECQRRITIPHVDTKTQAHTHPGDDDQYSFVLETGVEDTHHLGGMLFYKYEYIYIYLFASNYSNSSSLMELVVNVL